MLLGQPTPTPYDLCFNLLGFPVRIHPFFWVVGAILGLRSHDAVALVGWILAFTIGILFHELGHALVVRSYGVRPRITLYGMGGLTSYDAAAARRFSSMQHITVSVAGPGAGFLLAATVIAVLGVSTGAWMTIEVGGPRLLAIGGSIAVASPLVQYLAYFLVWISVFWGLINLMPVYPLDGGQIAREVFLLIDPHRGIELSLWLSVFAGVGLAAYALLAWQSILMTILFGYLGYSSYATLEAYRGGGSRW